MNDDLWHFDNQAYRLVDPVLVSYPRSRRVKDDATGRVVLETLPPLEFGIVTAWPVAAKEAA